MATLTHNRRRRSQAARKCFEMIDDDQSGTLEKAEIVTAVKSNQKVIKFLINCGNKNLQYLLVPACVDQSVRRVHPTILH